ncbi:ABC transporter permease [Chitinophaga flava]|uniref:ABC transporter permease n=1 Tax=Chitinophaga flava TaxID=2259036 RepID=A0A365XTX4_9BACT|nr:ABC transporter permease [Chitinophaga flava]RBL89827.1 hypothetical protein DF182_25415 [Chitinophaga flava]
MIAYIHSLQSEWLKKRHSAAAWLTVAGGLFVPLFMLCVRFYYFDQLPKTNAAPDIWEQLYNHAWRYMSFFLLPMGVILTTSLITQLETSNNTWKLLHVTPQRPSIIFLAKLTVILLMLLQFFLLFNIGIYLTGIVPALLVRDVPFPAEAFPWLKYLNGNWQFLITCLPIVALQYLLGLLYRNFLLPLGVGLGLYITAMIVFRWKYSFIIPYIYCVLVFNNSFNPVDRPVSIQVLATGYFLLFSILAYVFYINKKEKG